MLTNPDADTNDSTDTMTCTVYLDTLEDGSAHTALADDEQPLLSEKQERIIGKVFRSERQAFEEAHEHPASKEIGVVELIENETPGEEITTTITEIKKITDSDDGFGNSFGTTLGE